MSLEQLRHIIAQQIRVRLGEWPTPLLRLNRLAQRLGVELFMKRDELSGIALGGNKIRKMEFIHTGGLSIMPVGRYAWLRRLAMTRAASHRRRTHPTSIPIVQ